MTAATEEKGRRLPSPPLRQQVGLMRRLFVDPSPVLDQLAAEIGPVSSMGAGPMRMAIVGDPVALREMFGMGTEPFRWGHKFNVLGFVVGPESMIVSDGPEHKRRRASVQTAFSRRRLNGWIPMIVERTDAAIDRLVAELDTRSGPTDPVELYAFGRSLVLDIVVRALFGERLAARATDIGDLFQGPQDYLESPAFKQFPHPIPGTKRAKVRADRVALDAIIDEQIAYLRAHPNERDEATLDVLATLVDDPDVSDSETRDQVATLMGAGYDTTAATLSWMFWCISLADGLWDRLRTEADTVFGEVGDGAAPDEKTLAALDLADRTMRETTRLHPAGVLSPREAAEDVVIGGYRIPKGTLILWSPHLAGRDPNAWSDPLTFDPDRFIDETISEDQKALADIAWVPFGRGSRNCIGFALAQIEVTLIISRIAQRLDIESLSAVLPRPKGMVVNRPDGGAPMKVTPRRLT